MTSLSPRKGSRVLSGDQREGFCPGREATGTDAPRGKQPGAGTLWAQRGSPDSGRPTPCQALLGTSVPLDTGGMLTPNLRARTLSPGRLREPLLQMALLANVPAGGLTRCGRRAALGKPQVRRQPARGGLGVLQGAQSTLFFLKAVLAVDTGWPVGSDGSSSQSPRAGEQPSPPTAPAAGGLPGLRRAPPACGSGSCCFGRL